MTIDERAEDVAYDLEVNDWHEDGCSLDYKDAKKKIAAAITEAVAEAEEDLLRRIQNLYPEVNLDECRK